MKPEVKEFVGWAIYLAIVVLGLTCGWQIATLIKAWSLT